MVRETYKILINRPEHISSDDMATYIVDAIYGWRATIENHPLTEINLDIMVLPEVRTPEARPKAARNWGQVVVEHLTKFKDE